MVYRREIDGLRAVAVMAVVLFHAGFDWFSGGYVGVDIFFVISGYLITTILLQDMSGGHYSLAGFYERRARRILPALFLVVLSCLPFAWSWMMPGQLERFAQSVAATFGFVSNYYFMNQVDYFAPAADQQPLLHTWSLAVEEQFYLVMPFFLLFIRHFGMKMMFRLTCAVALVSLLVAHRGALHDPEETFFEPESRAWELLIGSVLAMLNLQQNVINRVSTTWASCLSAGGLLMMLLAIILFDRHTPVPGAWGLLPVLGAAAVIAFASPANLTGRLLGSPVPVAIGLISYSVYLWHFPVLAFARIRYDLHESDHLLAAGLVLLTLLLAWGSYRWVEQPCRRVKLARSKVFVLVLVGILLMLGISAAGYLAKGFPGRLDASQMQRLEAISTAMRETTVDNGQCVFNTDNPDVALEDRFSKCAAAHGSALIILGDSHAEDLFNAIARNSQRPFIVGLAKRGCRPHYRKQGCHYDAALEFIKLNASRIEAVLYKQEGNQFLDKHCQLPVIEKSVYLTQDFLQEIKLSVPVIWVGPHAEPDIDLRNLNVLFRYVTALEGKNENKLINVVDDFLASENRKKSIPYVSLRDAVNYQYEKDYFVEGRYTYSDSNHWSEWGEVIFGRRIMRDPVLKPLLVP